MQQNMSVDLIIKAFVVGYIETNMYLIVSKEQGTTGEGKRAQGSGNRAQGIVIDPGFIESETDSIFKQLRKKVNKIPYIFLTHCHFDHISGVDILKKEFNSKIYCHQLEKEKLEDPQKSGAVFFGFPGSSIIADEYLKGGEEIKLLDLTFKIIHTPGHTQGGISILLENKFLFSGDTIFKDSIGRTDLYGGSYEEEISSIKNKILTLPPDTIIYPGHGSSTTVKEERKKFETG